MLLQRQCLLKTLSDAHGLWSFPVLLVGLQTIPGPVTALRIISFPPLVQFSTHVSSLRHSWTFKGLCRSTISVYGLLPPSILCPIDPCWPPGSQCCSSAQGSSFPWVLCPHSLAWKLAHEET